MEGIFLGILLVSFGVHFLLLLPFIHFLYSMRLQRQRQKTKDAFNRPTPIFDSFNKKKAGTPIGGGLLLIVTTTLLFLLALPTLYFFWVPITSLYRNTGGIGSVVKIVLFTFISFGCLGLYDDIKKVFFFAREQFFGLRLRHKFALEVVLSVLAGYWLYAELKIEIIHIPFLGIFDLGIWYILFAAFVILAFANAFNITDGLDGLSTGCLLIALVAFWVISSSILDTTLALFIAIWIGGLIGFLYFNVFPARLFLGDVGSLAFGATFAVIGLLLGKTFSLLVIGGIFVAEIASSFFQLTSKKYRGKKLMVAAPLHLWLQARGWHETTIVFRAWTLSILLAIIGLWLAFIT